VKSAEFADGRTVGDAAAPESAQGLIVGGGDAESTYSISGGQMRWLRPAGAAIRIPLGADEFDPSRGASLRLNGHEFRTDSARGAWTREGQVWKYSTKEKVARDAFTLALDFEKARWNFAGNRLDLANSLRAGEKAARLELAVNGRYTFACNVEHQAKHDWRLTVPPRSDGTFDLLAYKGNWNSASDTGIVLFQGRLPADLREFGDLSLVMNGLQRDMFLLSAPQLQGAIESGGRFTYEGDGLYVILDFQKKLWSVEVKGAAFHSLMAPRWGGFRFAAKIGGEERCRAEYSISSYSTQLSFGAPELAIARDLPRDTVTLSWAMSAEGWVLEEASALTGPAASWSLVPANQYQTSGVDYFVTLPATSAARFYRLRQP
jgi:hypothetical protein